MTNQLPSSAEEALRDGWHMVCVLPSNQLFPSDILDRIKVNSRKSSEFSYTHKNAQLKHPKSALWVQDGNWKTPTGREILHLAKQNHTLKRFVREIIAEYNLPFIR